MGGGEEWLAVAVLGKIFGGLALHHLGGKNLAKRKYYRTN